MDKFLVGGHPFTRNQTIGVCADFFDKRSQKPRLENLPSAVWFKLWAQLANKSGKVCACLGSCCLRLCNFHFKRSTLVIGKPFHFFLEGFAVIFQICCAHIAPGREDVTVRGDFFELHGFAEAEFVGVSRLRGFGFPCVVTVRNFFDFLGSQFQVDAVIRADNSSGIC
jgi:hypothetical protein